MPKGQPPKKQKTSGPTSRPVRESHKSASGNLKNAGFYDFTTQSGRDYAIGKRVNNSYDIAADEEFKRDHRANYKKGSAVKKYKVEAAVDRYKSARPKKGGTW